MMPHSGLYQLYVVGLRDLLGMEQALSAALPELVASARTPEAEAALREQLRIAHEHRAQLEEQLLLLSGEEPAGTGGAAITAIVREALAGARAGTDPILGDAALLATSQRTVALRGAAYRSALLRAQQVGEAAAAMWLQQALADSELLAQRLNEVEAGIVTRVRTGSHPGAAPAANEVRGGAAGDELAGRTSSLPPA
jgi:ferritin-like metal-binding protein YciE